MAFTFHHKLNAHISHVHEQTYAFGGRKKYILMTHTLTTEQKSFRSTSLTHRMKSTWQRIQLCLWLRERESRKERGFVLGVAVSLWGSIGLTSKVLGLWSRKRHRQEVRAGQASLEMLYHHYQQGTISHQGQKKLRGLRGCMYLFISACRAGIYLCECMNCVWQILHYRPGCFTCILIMFDSTWHLWKTSGKPSAIVSVLPCLLLRWSYQREMNLNCQMEEGRRE